MTEPRTLASLLQDIPGARLVRGDTTAVITDVQPDSRRVANGALFVAVPGFVTDGHNFLPQVANHGAAAVLVQQDRERLWRSIPHGPAVIVVDDSRAALASAAAWFYGHPGRELGVIGITGTDGKTTTSHMLTSVLEAAGARAGRLGTVDVYYPGQSGTVGNRMTTPEATEVQRHLRAMVDAGCTWAIVESTSHGLALHRLDHVEYDISLFTNVTGDHLDFHETFEAYREAKGELFAALETAAAKGIRKTAVVNADDPSANFMLGRAPGASQLRFGLEAREGDAEILGRNVNLRPDGSDFRIVTPSGMAEASINLPAIFNVSNALAAAAAGYAAGAALPDIARGLAACPGVPGRMERIRAGQPFEVIVDYAHTGDAVRKVLAVLREVCKGKLIIVVGAAGERDPGRRFGVARASAEGADFAIFTNEDPRTEDPAEIVREIGRHAEGAGRVRGQDFIEVEDRGEAINEAMRRAGPGDIVVVAGKGHEQSMVFGTVAHPWDDRDVARRALASLGFGQG
ncbi:MAG: UDP-N-acetylmuramoyl-L-alanyl-D-glutamate--2,6-diaminopimelate ligase [Dehalococcoidia bacterium]|nr:UDP-N-acetylmuramoyl-L-alanyl-D-glutamate--2,6-diaminopimelate ligase [Dehalococcoidia bacterium]